MQMLAKIIFVAALAVAVIHCNSDSSDVMYQSFNWAVLSEPRSTFYQMVESEVSYLASCGINGIWFPPPSETADQQGYMPGEWYDIIDGTYLQSATSATKNAGMKVIMDMVLNHRSGQAVDSCTGQYSVFKNPDWGNDKIVKDDYLCNGGVTIPDNCGPGNYDTGENVCYCPDIDHTNTAVQGDIMDWMKWLQTNYNVDSFRFDDVKGYNGEYVKMYVDATNPEFAVGECFDGNTGTVINWLQEAGFVSTAFDFPNRDYLNGCVSSNDYSNMQQSLNPAGVLGVYPASASPFIDNHDTARNDRFAGGNQDMIIQGYAYILTHPGTPFVFYEDWNIGYVQTAIKKFIQIRKNNQLTSTSPIYIIAHEGGLYAAYLGPGANAPGSGTVAMKLGTNSWQPTGSGWNLATSGNNYAIWTK